MKTVIEMAREAGYQHPDAIGRCEDFAYFDLERFAELVRADEREACAKVCEHEWGRWAVPVNGADYNEMWVVCAAAIRARGENT